MNSKLMVYIFLLLYVASLLVCIKAQIVLMISQFNDSSIVALLQWSDRSIPRSAREYIIIKKKNFIIASMLLLHSC